MGWGQFVKKTIENIIYRITSILQKSRVQHAIKGIVSDSNNIILWHESEDINKNKTKQNKTKQNKTKQKKKKKLISQISVDPILRFQVMHDYVWFIAPIDYSVE